MIVLAGGVLIVKVPNIKHDMVIHTLPILIHTLPILILITASITDTMIITTSTRISSSPTVSPTAVTLILAILRSWTLDRLRPKGQV